MPWSKTDIGIWEGQSYYRVFFFTMHHYWSLQTFQKCSRIVNVSHQNPTYLLFLKTIHAHCTSHYSEKIMKYIAWVQNWELSLGYWLLYISLCTFSQAGQAACHGILSKNHKTRLFSISKYLVVYSAVSPTVKPRFRTHPIHRLSFQPIWVNKQQLRPVFPI